MAIQMETNHLSVREAYFGSDGGATLRVMTRLKKAGRLGLIAAQLFRAQKASSRAKKYRGGIRRRSGEFDSYRELAYEKKEKALGGLCSALVADSCGIRWGWKPDPKQPYAKFVVYIDLPNGQCSFHSPERLAGPDHDGEWDGDRGSEARIIEFCERVLAESSEECGV